MYRGLGIHWASSIPAFLALACLPFPFLFYKYGAEIRKKCKYAAESEAFMQKLRGNTIAAAQQNDDDDSDSSRTHAERMEEAAEQEAVDYSFENERQPRFEEMKTGKEAVEKEGSGGASLQKVGTGRSVRSTRSRRSILTVNEYYDNPYEIDRVHTKDSFKPGRARAGTGGSSAAGIGKGLFKTKSRP